MSETPGERSEGFSDKQESEWDDLKEVPFAGAEGGFSYDKWAREAREANEAKLREEKETKLRHSISMAALLKDVDEPVAREARLIDNLDFAQPGQEAMIGEKREAALERYRSLNKKRMAERRVLEEMSDSLIGDDGRWWKREDIIDDLDWRTDNARKNKEKDWLATVQACRSLKSRLEKFDPDFAETLGRDDMEYWDKLTQVPEKMFSEKELRPKTISTEELSMLFGEDEDRDSGKKTEESARSGEEQPVSYHFEAGIASGEVTISVGQDIPDSWFEQRHAGNSDSNGFGMIIERSPLIEEYLQQALNVEFGKIQEDERRNYSYASIASMIKEETRRTKKVPDIAAIIKANRRVAQS